ncbi:hypothetical protein [Crocosphaera chwakensis]|uniref:Uncharacterized protein n=1 Tax=Crocosphaera chwakensis CCY0110 TaxID=391612 RepID=A3IYY6_9CHRO|nr:hypothetical protein [Crocosphaera chwakensis]EAZ88326.1 hypothetical protein CY0110_14870 [Crocosphaera chwakensis CCY0110]
MQNFYVSWHQPNNGKSGCKIFDYCLVSVNRLLQRKSNFLVKNWILDSGAFTRITSEKGHLSIENYANLVNRWQECGNLQAAVTQDFPCNQLTLKKLV